MTGVGYITQVSPKASTRVNFQYDPESCDPSGGVGGWTEVPRPLTVAGTEFTGTPLLKLTIVLMLDGYASGASIEPTIAQYYAWGTAPTGRTPPVLQLHYGVYDRLRWVIQDVQVANALRGGPNSGSAQRTQAQVTLTLLEYQGLTASRTAADSVRSQIIATNTATGNGAKNPAVATYTVHPGDTLQKIAARQLGNASRWGEIAKLNGIKDPVHLKVGVRLKMPAK